jgi:hypothetical protein
MDMNYEFISFLSDKNAIEYARATTLRFVFASLFEALSFLFADFTMFTDYRIVIFLLPHAAIFNISARNN